MSKQFITIDNKHKISYKIYGNGENTIIFLHGLIGSSWISPEWKKGIDEANVNLIVLDRIGHGGSSQFEMENVGNWISIIKQIVKELNINNADVIGLSAGAPYAYASAYALPNVIKKIWILSGVPAVYEDSIIKHYSKESQTIYKSFIEKTVSEIQEYYVNQLKRALEHLKEGGEDYIVKTIEEALNQNCYGMALESKLQILPWKLQLSDIQQPIVMYHAKEDEMVPFIPAKEMCLQFFQNCTFKEMMTTGKDVHIKSCSYAFLELLCEYK